MRVLIHISLLIIINFMKDVYSLEMDNKHEYYSDATLICDEKALNLPYTTFLKYWILPSGRMLEWNQKPERKYIVGNAPDFNLTVTHISDDDFGWYYCVILWDNYIYLTHSIKVGLNVNGADFEDLFQSYQASAAIGSIAAASTAMLIALACSVYWCRYSKINTQNKQSSKAHTYIQWCLNCRKPRNDDKNSEDGVNEKDTDETSRKTEEREAIYVLDSAVKGFDDRPTSFGSVTGGDETMTLGQCLQMEISRRNRCDSGSPTANRIPTPPPPPPLPMATHDALDEYDKIPQRRKYSNSIVYGNQNDFMRVKSAQGNMAAGQSDRRNGYVNPGFENEMNVFNSEKMTEEEQGIDVIDSYVFQEDMQEDLII